MKRTVFLVVVFFLGLLVASSCSGTSSKKNQENENFDHNQVYKDSCLQFEIFETIKSYILSFSSDSIIRGETTDEIVAYYSVYFFEKENYHYFTIWVNTSLPHDFLEHQNPMQSFNYSHLNILGSDVILIRLYEYSPDVYYCVEMSRDEMLSKVKMNKFDVVNDGSWYPKSYRYFKDSDTFKIEELEVIKANFLGEEYLRFEMYLNSLENKQ